MYGKKWYLLCAIIYNDSFIALFITLNCAIFIACRRELLWSATHILRSFKLKRADLNGWGTFDGINIFPFGGLALLKEWIPLMKDSISWYVTTRNALKLFINTRISLQTCVVSTLRGGNPGRYYCHLWFLCDGIRVICYNDINIIQTLCLHGYFYPIIEIKFYFYRVVHLAPSDDQAGNYSNWRLSVEMTTRREVLSYKMLQGSIF